MAKNTKKLAEALVSTRVSKCQTLAEGLSVPRGSATLLRRSKVALSLGKAGGLDVLQMPVGCVTPRCR